MESVFNSRHIHFTANHWLTSTYGRILRYDTRTCADDVNHDSIVNISDLATLPANYSMTAEATCEEAI